MNVTKLEITCPSLTQRLIRFGALYALPHRICFIMPNETLSGIVINVIPIFEIISAVLGKKENKILVTLKQSFVKGKGYSVSHIEEQQNGVKHLLGYHLSLFLWHSCGSDKPFPPVKIEQDNEGVVKTHQFRWTK